MKMRRMKDVPLFQSVGKIDPDRLPYKLFRCTICDKPSKRRGRAERCCETEKIEPTVIETPALSSFDNTILSFSEKKAFKCRKCDRVYVSKFDALACHGAYRDD